MAADMRGSQIKMRKMRRIKRTEKSSCQKKTGAWSAGKRDGSSVFDLIYARLTNGLILIIDKIEGRVAKDARGTILFDNDAIVIHKKLNRIRTVPDIQHFADV